jgi:hypothetical protein
MDSNYILTSDGELYHYGVKGMKWGVRRYQRKDGSLTPAGKKRQSIADAMSRKARGHGGPGVYLGGSERRVAGAKRDLDYLNKGGHLSVGLTKKRQAQLDARDRASLEKTINDATNKNDNTGAKRLNVNKRVAIGVAVTAGIIASSYGAYKLSGVMKNKAYTKALKRGQDAISKCMKSFDDKEIYSLRGDKLTTDSIMRGLKRSNSLSFKLGLENNDYAKRASKNTIQAIKTLTNRNYELPLADLVRMGVVDVDHVLNRYSYLTGWK